MGTTRRHAADAGNARHVCCSGDPALVCALAPRRKTPKPADRERREGGVMTGAMPQRLKAFLANTALVVISLAITYLVGEFVFFRYLLPDMSMNLRPHLPDRADFFLQNSKAELVPHDYIALVGDSYAQGMGDWLLSVGGRSDQPYHSANVIHDLLGRDVVTFGRASAGSAEGMVLRLTRVLGDSYCYIFPPI
jgi:hypothetical protein